MPAGIRSGNATVKYFFIFEILNMVCVVATMVVGLLCASVIDGGKAGHLRGCVFLVIILAAVIFVVTLFGFCGAAIESYTILLMFAILLIIITVCEVFAAIVMFITAAGFEPVVGDVFKLARDGGDGSALARSFVNDVQMNLRCWAPTTLRFWDKLPSSCCYNGNTCNSLQRMARAAL
ncbi:uncharacterized protein LOC117652033 [Thrips palmi]|uniref:Uncharacterized protein LOC117652033 n=1 Tax=Thrips palmi TaxID=161013 RepID=A0A6P9A3X2_THRPL|nr:uncharacterized protein LOC117652033 [Thrips palmi]